MSGYPGQPQHQQAQYQSYPPQGQPQYQSQPQPQYQGYPPQGYGAAAPPEPSYQRAPAQQTVVIAQGIGKEPQRLVCPLCRYDGFSIVTYSPNSTTWISCFVLGFFGFCCIPFCVNSLQRATHQCPSCRGIIAVAD